MTGNTAADQLGALVELDALLSEHRIRYWLFGGWAVDFHLGRVTRAHSDLDIAVEWRHAEPVASLLAEYGWVHAPEPDEDGYTHYARGSVHSRRCLPRT